MALNARRSARPKRDPHARSFAERWSARPRARLVPTSEFPTSMAWSDRDLRTTVERLAAASEQQLEWLTPLGPLPSLDELALEFDDEFGRVREAIAADSASSLVALDAQLLRMSGAENAELWRPEALEGPDCRWPRWLPQPPPSEVRWGSA